MGNKIFYLLSILVLIYNVNLIIRCCVANNKKIASIYNKKRKIKKAINYIILIPVFNEQQIVKKTVRYFHEFCKQYNNVECIFITTEKEKNTPQDVFTYEIISAEIKKLNSKLRCINYPYKNGNKSNQLNYVLKKISVNVDMSNTYICIYDADSRPDFNSIHEVTNIICNNNANVIQQPNIANINYRKLNFYLKTESCFQTLRSYAIERYNAYVSTFKIINKIIVPYSYCVGHGLIVNFKFLMDNGLFPSPFEDVTFGFKMILSKTPVYPTVSADYCQTVESFKDLFFQSGNWIKPFFYSLKIYKETIKTNNVSIYRKIIFFIKVLIDFYSWFSISCYYIFSLVLTFYYKDIMFFILSIFVVLFSNIVLFYPYFYIYKNHNIKNFVKILLFSLIREIVRSLAIFSYIYQKFNGWYYDSGRKK